VTVWMLFEACRRHWRILLAGLLLTSATALFVASQEGVYWAQSDVRFHAPISPKNPNSLSSTSDSLISMGALIEREINGGSGIRPTSSSTITLVDEGVRDGHLIRLPSTGGQWAYNFSRPVLDVQAVASTPELVRARMRDLQAQIQSALNRRQTEAVVNQFNQISLQFSPVAIEVHFSGPRTGRAVGATVGLGIAVSLAVTAVVYRRRRPELFEYGAPLHLSDPPALSMHRV
jgi:hypothetical protein